MLKRLFSFSGPRLATKLFIIMSLTMVVIPWFSYLYLREMEAFLIDSQANAQRLTAEGISTLLNGRTDLFHELPLSPDGYDQLYAHPLESPVRIDGKDNDWEDILDFDLQFGEEPEQTEAGTQFYLLLGEHNELVYVLARVIDDQLVFRDSTILRLDVSDHLRLNYTDALDQNRKMVITMPAPGVTTAYDIDDEWRYATQSGADNRVQGFVSETSDGYIAEFRFPLAMLGSTRQFGLAVVDVDDAVGRSIESITSTLPSAGHEAYGLVLLKSPEVLKIVQGLGYSGANIQVIDTSKRVRAEVGSYDAATTLEPNKEDASAIDRFLSLTSGPVDAIFSAMVARDIDFNPLAADQVISTSLEGTPNHQLRFTQQEGEVIIAAHPIIAQDDTIGTVVLTQNTERILELRRDALGRIVNFSVLALFIFVALVMAFSVTLARRIRKLGAETTDAIDAYGRLKTNRIHSETESGDEIGDLARNISNMLSRLHQHNQFLENMPRTLRHEINNPLNALSTSLQNLASEEQPDNRAKYLDSAQRAVLRIGMIVQNLADAASLEEALEADDFEVIDLRELVNNYLNNCRVLHPKAHFEYRGTHKRVLSAVSDYRIEQLLDKLIDNAVDFSVPGTTITVGLTTDAHELTLFVTNEGPTIPREELDNIFDSMVSVRQNNPDNRLHFGMGLYVVRVIAEHHGGQVSAVNLLNRRGVTVRVTLSLYREQTEELMAAI